MSIFTEVKEQLKLQSCSNKADMEKEKAALAVSIQKERQQLSQLASIKAEIKSVEQIPIGKTMFGGKIT